MLAFFRKYQKFFFLFTTTIVVVSFVFFGTYQAFAPTGRGDDPVAFRTVDGKKVRQSQLKQMAYFLGHERGGHPLAGNFLNDGVVSREVFETGVGLALFSEKCGEELEGKLKREREYVPFVHMHAPAVSALNVWQLFAPEIAENLTKVKRLEELKGREAFETQVALFLAEKHFPPAVLGQMLRYQEKDNNIPPDPRLARGDLALFSYRDLNDWFGTAYVEEVAMFVLQGAALARKAGYTVTEGEAFSELLYKTEQVYAQVREYIGKEVPSGYALFQRVVANMGLTEQGVVKIWQEILLFRRYVGDVSAGALVDLLPFKEFYGHANAFATVDVFKVADPFVLKDEKDLGLFEAYLQAVAPQKESVVAVPREMESVEVIQGRAPELVGRQYTLRVAETSKKSLQARVTVKETWAWEVDERNWGWLTGKFPELALAHAEGEAARSAALEQMEPKGRAKVDAAVRKQIVEAHPGWIEEGLMASQVVEKTLFLRPGQEKAPLKGVDDSRELYALLERGDVERYSPDGETFYRIEVVERGEPAALDFASAKEVLKPLPCGEVVDALVREGQAQGWNVSRAQAPLLRFLPLYDQEEIAAPWKIERSMHTVTRTEEGPLPFEVAGSMEELVISDVHFSPTWGPFTFRLLDKKVDRAVPIDKLLEAQELLSSEVKSHLMQQLLKEMGRV